MDRLEQFRAVFVLGPILAMLSLGMWLTLRSGVPSLATGAGVRRLVSNLSQAAVLIGAWVLGLVIVQHAIGFHFAIP
jgi:hypothetical protein